jgi:hypothetical protein
MLAARLAAVAARPAEAPAVPAAHAPVVAEAARQAEMLAAQRAAALAELPADVVQPVAAVEYVAEVAVAGTPTCCCGCQTRRGTLNPICP